MTTQRQRHSLRARRDIARRYIEACVLAGLLERVGDDRVRETDLSAEDRRAAQARAHELMDEIPARHGR